jgi:hypothetical protein
MRQAHFMSPATVSTEQVVNRTDSCVEIRAKTISVLCISAKTYSYTTSSSSELFFFEYMQMLPEMQVTAAGDGS